MTVDATNSVTQTSASTATTTANSTPSTKFTADVNSFLKLLTVQLQNQDPTKPLDPNEFTSELVQFSSVEQLINMNTNLGTLIGFQKTNQTLGAANYLGTTVEAKGSQMPLMNGTGQFTYTLGSAADSSTLSILDSSGKVVYRAAGETGLGKHSFTWDGTDMNGNHLSDGIYSVQVNAIAGKSSVPATIGIVGQVTGINPSSDPISLSVGGVPVTLDQVIEVR